MFCKHCGTKNPEGSIYCINDGIPLTGLKEGAQVKNGQVKFCKNCRHEIEKNSLYCSQCSVSQEIVVENNHVAASLDISNASFGKLKGVVSGNVANTSNFSNVISIPNLINSSKFAGIAFGILFVISFIISSIINSKFKDLLLEDAFLGEAASFIGKLKVVSVTDIMMLGHLTGVEYSANAMIFEGSIVTKGGLFLFAIIPAIALITAGFLANRNSERFAIERLYTVLPIALIYALLVGFVGIFAGISIEVPDPSGWLGAITVKAEYQFLIVLFNSFIAALIFVTLGSMIGLSKEMKEVGGNKGYGISIYKAVLHSVLGILICLVAAYGVIGTDDDFNNEDMPGVAKAVIISQLGGYFWNLAHFNTLSLEVDADYESVDAKYSILGGGTASEDEEEFNEMIDEVFGNLWFLFIIPLLLHFWAGSEIRKSIQGNILYELGVYAFALGVVNALIFTISKFSLETTIDDLFAISFGFSFLTTLLFGAIFAFATAYVGVMVTNKNN